MSTDTNEFISDLDGGVLAEKLSRGISNVAAGVVDYHKEGEITLKLKIKQIGATHQINISHEITTIVPTLNGKVTEKNITETPMHVGKGGRVTLFPENQGQLFTKKGAIETNQQEP